MKMHFRLGLFLASLVLLSACSLPHYQYRYESEKAVDFRKGKWLINRIEADLSLKSKALLTEKLLKEIRKLATDSVVYVQNIQLGLLTPEQLRFEPSEEILNTLKNTTDFDFILNIRADKVRDDLSPILLYPMYSDAGNEVEIYIDIYNIAKAKRIYSQWIIASIAANENIENVQFSFSASGLIIQGLKKGIKRIKKHAITSR